MTWGPLILPGWIWKKNRHIVRPPIMERLFQLVSWITGVWPQGPRSVPGGAGAQSAFVDETRFRPSLPAFFIAGHSTRFQRILEARQNSIARRSGRWQPEPVVAQQTPDMAGMVLGPVRSRMRTATRKRPRLVL